MAALWVLNGPNLNLLGEREPEIYGRDTLADIERMTAARADALGHDLVFRQTNAEGELVGWVQEARGHAAALIVNAAGYTHTSVALLDALTAVVQPKIELHLSNPGRRESFRHHSYVTPAVDAVIAGLGAAGYPLAVDAAHALIARRAGA